MNLVKGTRWKKFSNPGHLLCAIPCFLSDMFLGNHLLFHVDIWYVGGARAEGVHAEF